MLWKHLNLGVDEKWSQWALEMMQAGFDTEHLVELASIEKPYNQFELKELTDKVFEELNLDFSDQDKVVRDYTTYVAREVVSENRSLSRTLMDLKNLCIALDHEKNLNDFYLLFFAREDLKYSEVQHYWNGADRSNIDQICIDYFKQWLKDSGGTNPA